MVAESTTLTVRESAPPVIVPRTLGEMIDIAERLSKSSLLPEELRGKVPEVLMQIMAGQELGLYSMASLRSFHIIKGKPVMGADAMVAVILGSGKAEYFKRVGEGTNKSVTYATKRRGLEEQRCTWTWDMALDASLTSKETWRAHPRQMLASRAKAELARDVYPDVLTGCYTADEIESEVRRDRSDVQDAEFVETKWSDQPAVMVESIAKGRAVDAALGVTPAERARVEESVRQMFEPSDYPEIGEIETASNVADLKALAARFSARKIGPGAAYDAMAAAYKTRLQWVKAQPSKAVGAMVDAGRSALDKMDASDAARSASGSGGSTGETP